MPGFLDGPLRLNLGTAAASRPYLGFRSSSFSEDVVEVAGI